MIYEIAVLPVYKDKIRDFRQAFEDVVPLLTRSQGYCGHVLAQGIETPEVFNLIVRWRSLEDHTPGFEASEDHEDFMKGIEEFFSTEPTVYHLEGGDFAANEHEMGMPPANTSSLRNAGNETCSKEAQGRGQSAPSGARANAGRQTSGVQDAEWRHT